jgi:hypothetical protein
MPHLIHPKANWQREHYRDIKEPAHLARPADHLFKARPEIPINSQAPTSPYFSPKNRYERVAGKAEKTLAVLPSGYTDPSTKKA